MIRRNPFVAAAAALAFSSVGIVSVSAAPVITGNVSCILKGNATLKPGLPLTSPGPATKVIKTKVKFRGTLEGCTGAQAGTKGDAQIQGGTLSAKGTIITNPGDESPSCAGLANQTGQVVIKASPKFTNSDSGKPKSIAKSTTSLTLGTVTVGATVEFDLAGTVSKGAFLGQPIQAHAVLDLDAGQLAGACQQPGGLATLSFTGVKGDSTIAVN